MSDDKLVLVVKPAPRLTYVVNVGKPGKDGVGGGEGGVAATVSVGSVVTGAPGSPASVSNAGSATAAVLNFTIPRGNTGLQGAKGDKGDKGDTGEQGLPGLKGDKGDKGDTGEQGLQGLKGDKGDKGDTGEQGLPGLKGDKGDKGDTGEQGLQGLKGDKGDKGDPGEQGLQGLKGDKGDTGDQGTQGIPGPNSVSTSTATSFPAGTILASDGAAVKAVEVGAGAGKLAAGDDARFTDSRTPTSHKSSHAAGGSDPLTPADIGAATAAQGGRADSALQPNGSGAGLSGVINSFHYQTTDFIGNPILADTTYNRRDPSRIIKVGSTYYMYYTRALNIPVVPGAQIWYATAPAITGPWTEQGMALDMGTGMAWDSNAVYTPDILVSGGTYYLFYTGQSTIYSPFAHSELGVATASSPEGPFTKSPSNPILSYSTSAGWEDRLVDAAYPLKMPDGSWRLYYKGRTSTGRSIGYATATAGGFPTTWTKYSGNPVFGMGINGSPNLEVENGEPILMNGRFYMLAQSMVPNTVLETRNWYESADGATNWVKSSAFESVDTARRAGAWDAYESMGAKVAPLEGELSYIVSNGAPNSSSDKIGLGIYLLTRTAGDKPVFVGLSDSAAIDKSAGAVVGVVKNGVRFSLLTGTSPYNLVQLDSVGKLPAIDGSQLINLPTGGTGTVNSGSTGQFAFYAGNGTTVVGRTLVAGDIPNIAESQVTGLVANLANKLGATAQAADSAKVAGVTPSANALTLLGHNFSQMLTDIGAQPAGSYLTPSSTLDATKLVGVASVDTSGTSGGLSADIPESRVTGLVADLAGKESVLTFGTGLTRSANTITANPSQVLSKITVPVDSTTAIQITKADGTTPIISVDTTNSQVGINTANPAGKFHVVTDSGSALPFVVDQYGDTGSPSFSGRKACGSLGAPTQVLADKILFALSGRPWFSDTLAWATSGYANISLAAAENITSTSHGTYIDFKTTANGNNSMATRVRIQNSGGVSIGSTTDPGAGNLSVAGTTASKQFIETPNSTGLVNVSGTVTPACIAESFYGYNLTGATTITLPNTGLPAGVISVTFAVVGAQTLTFTAASGSLAYVGSAPVPPVSSKETWYTAVTRNQGAKWSLFNAGTEQ